MPNWCYTQIAFYGPYVNELEKFRSDIKTAIDFLPIVGSEARNWQGRVARYYNSTAAGERGFLNDISLVYSEDIADDTMSYFILDQEDAWAPHTDMWSELLDELGYDINFVYRAEEPGDDIYINTDYEGNFFPDRYIVDTPDETEYFITEEELLGYLSTINTAFEGCMSVSEAQRLGRCLVDEGVYDWFIIREYDFE